MSRRVLAVLAAIVILIVVGMVITVKRSLKAELEYDPAARPAHAMPAPRK